MLNSSFTKIDKQIARERALSTIKWIEKCRKKKMDTIVEKYIHNGFSNKIRRFFANLFKKPNWIISKESAREYLEENSCLSIGDMSYFFASIYGFNNYDTAKRILLLLNNSKEDYIYISGEDLEKIS